MTELIKHKGIGKQMFSNIVSMFSDDKPTNIHHNKESRPENKSFKEKLGMWECKIDESTKHTNKTNKIVYEFTEDVEKFTDDNSDVDDDNGPDDNIIVTRNLFRKAPTIVKKSSSRTSVNTVKKSKNKSQNKSSFDNVESPPNKLSVCKLRSSPKSKSIELSNSKSNHVSKLSPDKSILEPDDLSGDEDCDITTGSNERNKKSKKSKTIKKVPHADSEIIITRSNPKKKINQKKFSKSILLDRSESEDDNDEIAL